MSFLRWQWPGDPCNPDRRIRRRREVGIRKALGATADQVALLLLRDFYRPVIVANVLAWPFAFMASMFYLNTFVLRAERGC